MKIKYAQQVAEKLAIDPRKAALQRRRGIGRTRAERGLEPYKSPKKSWDAAGPVSTHKVLVEREPSSRAARRALARARKADAREGQRRATKDWFAERQRHSNAIGVARCYFDVDGAHQRSPQACRNATARVHREAEQVSKRDGIPYTTALKKVEGQMLQLLTDAGLR